MGTQEHWQVLAAFVLRIVRVVVETVNDSVSDYIANRLF